MQRISLDLFCTAVVDVKATAEISESRARTTSNSVTVKPKRLCDGTPDCSIFVFGLTLLRGIRDSGQGGEISRGDLDESAVKECSLV